MSMIPSMRTNTKKVTYDVLADDVYEARLVRFIGLGIQEQPEWNGEKKSPAFKCSLQYELIGMDATGVDAEGKAVDPRPACAFQDVYLFPGGQRGKVFDMCRALDPSVDRVPNNLDWFIDKLGAPLMVQVGHYVAKDGTKRNKVVGVSGMSARVRNSLPAARSELIGFDPYVESPEMMLAYSKLPKFQREMLTEAHDTKSIKLAGTEPMKQEGGAPVASRPAPTQQTASKPAVAPAEDMPFDDDIPFAPMGLQYPAILNCM